MNKHLDFQLLLKNFFNVYKILIKNILLMKILQQVYLLKMGKHIYRPNNMS